MSDTQTTPTPSETSETGASRLLYWLAALFVLAGLLNSIPGIPGLDSGVQTLTGQDWFAIRKFPREWFFPLVFAVMMIIVALQHSMWRSWVDKSPARRGFGLFMDIALIVAGVGMSLTYLIEFEAICLIDQFTGERARLIAQSLESAKETAELYGLPAPTTVEDPQCVGTTGGFLVLIMGVAIVVFLAYNVKVWGLPLVIVAILVASYTIITILVWYFHGPDDINKYLMTKLGRPRVHDILVNNASGLLGRFMDIIMNTIFPYLILGSLFGASAGGQSLIKIAFRWTRNLAGGPAHAAIVSSAMFGTISGGPIVNVLSTGVLTIPMMAKRGFSKVFAGGMEAAASSGGSIMPPVMGVAAFVLAALTGVPYSSIIVAAAIPALCYFFCLFLAAVFQARKQKIKAFGELTPEMHMSRQDILNLVMIFGPILLILILLLNTKESVGCGPIGFILGVERIFTESGCRVTELPWVLKIVQNSADFCLKFTGLPVFISLDVLGWLKSLGLGDGGSLIFQFIALGATMALAVLLGMGMPAVPAYVNVALLMGPVLAGLGIAVFTAHMFIFYFAVASAITPPVALAAFAAASITKEDPMRTGFAAVKIGIVMFVIPFVFAMYPQILLIEQAFLDPTASGGQIAYLPGFDGTVQMSDLALILSRLALALYLLASALSAFDVKALKTWEWMVRLALAALVMSGTPTVWGPAVVAAIVLLVWHRMGGAKQDMSTA